MGFQHLNFIFSQKFISIFKGLFINKTNPRAKYMDFNFNLTNVAQVGYPTN
jgi:hypothetical protein